MKNGFAVLALILGIVIGAFVVGGVAYLYNRSNQSISNTTPSTPAAELTAPTTDTGTWKTHSNTSYKFEFKHPGDWQIEEFTSTFDSQVVSGQKVTGYSFTASNKTSLGVYPEGEFDHGLPFEQPQKKTITVGGKSAERHDYSNGYVYIVIAGYPSVDSPFRLEFTAAKESDLTIIDSILSTFKFAQ